MKNRIKDIFQKTSEFVKPPQEEVENNSQEWLEHGLTLLSKYNRFLWDFLGLFLISLALITFLALVGINTGAWQKGRWVIAWVTFLQSLSGFWGVLIFITTLTFIGILFLNPKRELIWGKLWGKVLVLEVTGFIFLSWRAIVGGMSVEKAVQGLHGGKIGYGLGLIVSQIFGNSPFMLSVEGFVLGIIVIIGLFSGLGIFSKFYRKLTGEEAATTTPSVSEGKSYRSTMMEPLIEDGPAYVAEPLTQKSGEDLPPISRPVIPVKKEAQQPATIPREFKKNFQVVEIESEEAANKPFQRDDQLPPLSLLATGRVAKPDERHINQSAGLIEKTLSEFGIPAKVVGFQVGPTVTLFKVEPGYKSRNGDDPNDQGYRIRVSQIASLKKDLALALSAERIRIQAPVPGQPYIGIEIPNPRAQAVFLRPMLESEEFQMAAAPLTVAIGRDVSGKPIISNLATLPHLLIAGTTGSGKSVCISAITASLIANNSPESLRLVMVDPKKVELVPFNGLPHLIGKVETDLERISIVLRWLVYEMERRYKLLEGIRARDINSYNRKIEKSHDRHPIPYIVVLIDELADLMMAAAEQTESTLVRLAQMSRAVGIHLVIATQRPSTDVVTGLIKANFPARLSFAVAMAVDSRVILDGPGAEALLGKGDLLFLPPDVGSPVRAQGVIVTDKEVKNLVDFWASNWNEDVDQPPPWELMLAEDEVLSDRDDLVDKAIQVIKKTRKASASHLQRALRVGYPRAARLVDELEDLGILGPSQGGGRERDILIDIDEDEDGLEDSSSDDKYDDDWDDQP
ncbi:MAG: hypothetical protein JXA19_00580 [Anaerolineales bacterium]|nr:hypothetical protein [Anaerolineales bacterium]